MNLIKSQLWALCQKFVQDRIDTAQYAIAQAQESANGESKSSMGDKYETGRSMAQLEIEKNTKQLAEALHLKQIMDKVEVNKIDVKVQLGSLVMTNGGNFYLSIAAGKLRYDGVDYFAVSLSSPVGNKLLGLSAGSKIEINGRHLTLLEVL